jgi:3-oxosteroid 1-dehydrogenase
MPNRREVRRMLSTDDNWDLEYDFVVGGTGIGGATAAITADEAGLDVVILDKSDKVGGVSTMSGGLVWVGNNHLEEAADIEDSADAVKEYIKYGSTQSVDEDLLDTFIDKGPEALEFLENVADVPWQIVPDSPDYLYSLGPGALPEGRTLEVSPLKRSELGDLADKFRVTPHFPVGVTMAEIKSWGGLSAFNDWDFELLGERTAEEYLTFGSGVMGHLLAEVDRRDIEVMTETGIERLVQADDRVVGVEASTEDDPLLIGAENGVLLAIGAYDWSEEKVERYEFVPEMESGAPPVIHGDHIDLTRSVSADVVSQSQEGRLPAALPGVHVPGEELEGEPLYRALTAGVGAPGVIVVNESGERFFNEAFWQDFVARIGQIDVHDGNHEHWPCFLVLDQDHRDKYPVAGIEPGRDLSDHLGEKAETIEDLARKLDIDPGGLAGTVETFNEYAREGTDPDFDRGETPIEQRFRGDPTHEPNANMAPLTTPPFYGIELDIVGQGIPSTGLRINSRSEVVDIDGDGVAGLYAAGNSAAYTDTGGAYDSGIAMSRGMTYGYIAANDAAGEGN